MKEGLVTNWNALRKELSVFVVDKKHKMICQTMNHKVKKITDLEDK